MFEVVEVYNGKNVFNIYNHNFSIEELDSIISKMLFDKTILNYLFTSKESFEDLDYIQMCRRFIPEEFIEKEKQYLNNWDESKKIIKKMIDSSHSFYSFYAEALMAYLNYKILDIKLISGVISIEETLSDQKTGADACMFSDNKIILGEAKFYKNFNAAKNKIIDDFSSKSLLNKIRNLYRKTHKAMVHLKGIEGTDKIMPFEDFINYDIILSGFILHNKRKIYSYEEIDNILEVEGLKRYNVVFYHLPINSKEELVYLVIKNALEEIVNESRR